jgi:O-antigen ligase
MSPTPKELSLSFGQINITAQFMAFTLPFIFVALMELKETRSKKGFALLSTLLILLYTELYFTACRSVWIGAVALLCYFFFYLRIIPFRRVALIVLSVALLIVGIQSLRSENSALKIGGYLSNKEDSSMLLQTTGRAGAWKATVQMIQDHPLGVGPDQFEAAFLQYHSHDSFQLVESSVWQSPHDEFLRILSEEGWLGLLFFAISSIALLQYLWRCTRGRLLRRALLVSTVLVWIPELLVQFPLGMANSVLPLALVLGALAVPAETPGSTETDAASISRALPLCALLLVFYLGGTHILSTYIDGKYPEDRDKIRLACRIYPSNWRACLKEVKLDAQAGDFDQAHAIVDRILTRYPDHFPTIRAASVLAFSENNPKEGCEYLNRYDQLFSGTSSLHSDLEKLCPHF